MDRTGFIFMLILAVAGRCTGSGGEHEYADSVGYLLDKPADYDDHIPGMSAAVTQNQKLINAQDNSAALELDLSMPEKVGGDEDNCFSVTTVKQPYAIRTNDSLTHNIVQLKNFPQKIKWTECFHNEPEKKACFESVFPAGGEVRGECGEKYGAVSLYAYEPRTRRLRYLPFQVPVGCACRFLTRD